MLSTKKEKKSQVEEALGHPSEDGFTLKSKAAKSNNEEEEDFSAMPNHDYSLELHQNLIEGRRWIVIDMDHNKNKPQSFHDRAKGNDFFDFGKNHEKEEKKLEVAEEELPDEVQPDYLKSTMKKK